MRALLSFVTGILIVFGSFSSYAAKDGLELVQAWIDANYTDCPTEFADSIYTTYLNQAKLTRIGSNECSISVQSQLCKDALKDAFAKYVDKANSMCKPNVTPATTSAQPGLSPANVSCDKPKGKSYTFTRQTGSEICRLQVTCKSDFSYAGKNFDKGDYEFTCHAVGDDCSYAHIDVDNCYGPTIQSIGTFFNGDVQKLTVPEGTH